MKKVEELKDLELAEALNSTWQNLVQFENQLKIIQVEIDKRKIKKNND